MGLFKKLRSSFVKDRHGTVSPANGQSNRSVVQNVTLIGKLSLVVATSVGVTALLVGLRHNQLLQSWELDAYDWMVRSRPVAPLDDRLLLVTVTENDIEREKIRGLSGATLNKLLAKLMSYQPKTVGINLYQNLESGLGDGVARKEDIISVCKFSSVKTEEIRPAQNVDIETVGSDNLILDDSDNIVRRGLLYADPDKKCKAHFSFAALLALNYLEKQAIEPNFFLEDGSWVLGKTILRRLTKTSGSYEKMDVGGAQIMINYRHPNVARQVTLSEVLDSKVDPNLIKDKLVIIGNTATSIDPSVFTPYTALNTESRKKPVIFIHAQVASQILSAVLDGKSMIWYWSDNDEIIWMWFWAITGGTLAWRIRNPLLFIVAFSISLCGLVGICYLLFLQAGWIPVIPPALGFVMTGVSVIAYTAYRTQVRTRIIVLQVEKQQEAIAQLSALLKDTGVDTVNTVEKKSGDFLLSGRYQINRVLGSGGFGCTYLAKDTQRPGNPTCVVKQLMPARRDTRFLEVARRLFDAEAEILLVLGKHIQIPDLLAYFEENNEFYLVQEYIKGQLLTQELSTNGVKDEAFAIEMLKSVLQVLKFVHEHRVIHRDIKPDNIIRNSQDNRLVLIDFGAVKTMQPPNSENTELATVAIGTRGYAPPEQFAGHPRLASDIYALGMIAIQAVTGQQPQLLPINPDTGNVEWRKMAQVSDELAAILDKMVCYHFSDRYQSAADVLEDLNRVKREGEG